jgi:tripartite-type tricarboxylate transporter receptor subunit TctC
MVWVPGWRVATGIMAAAMAGTAFAEDFPSRPITLVVPYAAGGPADTIARLVAGRMGQTLGRQFVIENVAGAGGTIGAARVAKAAPDGYTLLIHNLGLPAAPAFFKNLPYDARHGFEPIGLINTGPMVLVSRKTLSPKTAQELWAYLRANAGAVVMAHAGAGANSHLCGLLLAQALGTKATFVPYKGSGPAMNDILADQVDLLCDQSTTAVPQVEGGKSKPS